jgi:hypothetical protein
MTAIDEIIKELDHVRKQLAGYDELKEREERLSEALAILQGQGRMSAGRPPAPRGGGRSTAQTIDEGQIVHAVHVHGKEASAIDIRQALGLPDSASNALSVKLKKMVDEGTLKRIGERRASRYSVPS